MRRYQYNGSYKIRIKSYYSVENTAINLDAAEIPNLDAAKITSGTFADARLSQSSVQQYASTFDDNKIINDISTLAIRQASNENKSAYNTNSMYVDVFQDSSGIGTTQNATREDGEYVIAGSTGYGSEETLLDATGKTAADVESNNSLPTNLVGIQNWIVSDTYKFTSHYNTNNSKNGNKTLFGMVGESGQTTNTGTYEYFGHYTSNYGTSDNYIQIDTGNTSTAAYGHYYITKMAVHPTWNGNGVTIYLQGSATEGNWNDIISLAMPNNQAQTSSSVSNTTPYRWLRCRLPYVSNIDFGWRHWRLYGHRLVTTLNATGSFESNAITAPSSVNKMGAIITYQDHAGTNALNTDIVLKLSADGTNFTTATLTAMPDFASGIKMAKVNDLTIANAGTSLKYKIEFANQSATKEARIRGCSLQF